MGGPVPMSIWCGWAKRRMGRYKDADLPARDMRRMEAHLARCGACRELAGEEKAAAEALGAMTPEGLGACARRPYPAPLLPRFAATAAALLLLLWVDAQVSRWSMQAGAPPQQQRHDTSQAFVDSVMEDLGEYNGIADYVMQTREWRERPAGRTRPAYQLDVEEPWT